MSSLIINYIVLAMSSPLKTPIIPANNSSLFASVEVVPGHSHSVKCLRKEELSTELLIKGRDSFAFLKKYVLL